MTRQTKVVILQRRLVEATATKERADQALARAQADLDYLDTPCNLDCSGCGLHLATERDFAEHFTVPDWRYANLGYCPNKGPDN